MDTAGSDRHSADCEELTHRVKLLEAELARLRKSEEKYRAIFENSPCGIALIKNERTVEANQALLSIEGFPDFESFAAIDLMDKVTEDSKGIIAERRARRRAGQYVEPEFEVQFITATGEIKNVLISSVPVEIGDERFLISNTRDITHIKRAAKAIKISEERYKALVESTDDSIYVVGSNYQYIFMNGNHKRRMGFDHDDYMSQPYGKFHGPEETKDFMDHASRVFKTGKTLHQEHSSERDNMHFLRTLAPIADRDGRTIAVAVVSKNITPIKRLEEQLRQMSFTDELTGLYNRRGFYMLAEQQLRMARRMERGLSLLYADVDNLKQVNDEQGHTRGDLLLKEAARILRDNFRDSDITARMGGDEFVVMPIEKAESSVDAIRKRFDSIIDKYNTSNTYGFELSISIGIAHFDHENPVTLDKLISQADKAMYENKKARKRSRGQLG